MKQRLTRIEARLAPAAPSPEGSKAELTRRINVLADRQRSDGPVSADPERASRALAYIKSIQEARP